MDLTEEGFGNIILAQDRIYHTSHSSGITLALYSRGPEFELPDRGFSSFCSVVPGKCCNSTSNRQQNFPSASLPIYNFQY